MNERFSSTRSSIRSRSEVVSKTSDRKKSAAERLEADKMKYVKSEKVRQKRITSEYFNDSTGTNSVSTSSTASPTNADNSEVTMTTSKLKPVSYKLPLKAFKDDQLVAKSGRKLYNCVKDGLKPIGSHECGPRLSRTTTRGPGHPRSFSLGPNARVLTPSKPKVVSKVSSPTSQLKQIRDGLRKVREDQRFGVKAIEGQRSRDDSVCSGANRDKLMTSSKREMKAERSKPFALIENKLNRKMMTSSNHEALQIQENEMKSSRRHLKSFCSSTPKRERSTKDEDYQMMKLSQLSKSTSHQKHRTTSNKSSNENQAIFSRPKFLSYKNQAAIETRKTSIKTANCPGSRKSISERLEEILTPLEDAKTDAMLMPPPQTSSDPLLETPTEINTLIPSNFSTARSSSDSNEDQKMSTDLRTSSKLTPLLRKEVAPSTFNPLSGCHHEKIKSSKDHLEDQKMINTLNSQTTSSSASNEANKPLTAMTASDLKPKKDKRNPPDCHLVSKNRSSATSSSYQSNLWSPHNHQRSLDRSESSKLNNFFATMGGFLPSQSSNENLSFVANDFSDSNFSYAGASEYVRDDDEVEVKEVYATPSVSIIEKRARIMRWIVSCRSYFDQASSSSIPYYLPPKESSV